jgi:hypothetical protein
MNNVKTQFTQVGKNVDMCGVRKKGRRNRGGCQRTKVPFFVMKRAHFVQADVAVNTILY